jgi:hypothetical protein
VGVLALLATSTPVHARQNATILSTSINMAGGGSNRVRNPLLPSPSGNSFATGFYAFYPSLSLKSTKPNSSLTAHYAFGYNRTVGRSALPSESHTASLDYSSTLSPRWTTRISDTFRMTDGLGTFSAFSDVPQQSSTVFSFQSIGGRRLPRTNDVNADFDYALDVNSALSFNAQHSFRTYGGDLPTNFLISDQQHLSGGVAYKQMLGINESWSLGWQATYFDYGDFESALSQSVQADYSVGIGRYYTAHIGAGLSRTNRRGISALSVAGTANGTSNGKLSYDAAFGISRITTAQTVSLDFTQNSTDRVGLGSTAITRRGTLTWNRPMGRVTAGGTISAHKSEGILSNPVGIRAIEADARLGYQLTARLTVAGGADYRNTTTGSFGFKQKRVFYNGSLSYALTTKLFLSGGGTFDESRQSGLFDGSQKRLYVSVRYVEPNLHVFR